jgi:hypothetical protein
VVEHGLERAVARRAAGRWRGEKVEAGLHLGGDFGGREGADPGGGDLDGQGQALHELADAGDRGLVGGVDGEAVGDLPGARLEKANGGGAAAFPGRGILGKSKAVQVDDPLLLAGEPLAGSDEDGGAGRRSQNVLDQGDGGQQMLQVVEHEEELAVAEGGQQLIDDGLVAAQGHAQRLGEGTGDVSGPADGRQREPDDAVAVARGELEGRLRGEMGLAHAARPHQGQQPAAGIVQGPGNRLQLGLAANQGARQVGHGAVGARPGRRQGRSGVTGGGGQAGGRRLAQLDEALDLAGGEGQGARQGLDGMRIGAAAHAAFQGADRIGR